MSEATLTESVEPSSSAEPARFKRWARPAFFVAAGSVALAVGVVVYLTDRAASHAVLIPAFGALAGRHVFGAIGQWLPSFVHPFAFSLFTGDGSRGRASTESSLRVASRWAAPGRPGAPLTTGR